MLSAQELSQKVIGNVSKVIVGKETVIEQVLVALFCKGHVLLEDIPGTGKTTLAKTLSKSIDCDFKRVQFTPDLLPSDLTGLNFYNQKLQEFVFKQGPIFTNIVLADEINRATPRTQSSLLECMEESQITIDSVTYRLESPFFVIATQNPIETQGTFPLPEAQLDRFFVKLSMGYPGEEEEVAILSRFIHEQPLEKIEAVASREELLQVQEAIKQVSLSDPLKQYIVSLTRATRTHDKIRLGVSPRGTLALMKASQAMAAIRGRDFVTPDDVKAVAPAVLSHRIITKGYHIGEKGTSNDAIVAELLETVQAPVEN